MNTVILAEKPSQAKAYASAFHNCKRNDGFFSVSDPILNGETVITYGFGHLVELATPVLTQLNGKIGTWSHCRYFPKHINL